MSYLWYWPQGGWDFEKWKQNHDWEPIRSEQSGGSHLVPLVHRDGNLSGWSEQKARYQSDLQQLLGSIREPSPALEWDRLEEKKEAGVTRSLVRYFLSA